MERIHKKRIYEVQDYLLRNGTDPDLMRIVLHNVNSDQLVTKMKVLEHFVMNLPTHIRDVISHQISEALLHMRNYSN